MMMINYNIIKHNNLSLSNFLYNTTYYFICQKSKISYIFLTNGSDLDFLFILILLSFGDASSEISFSEIIALYIDFSIESKVDKLSIIDYEAESFDYIQYLR